MTRGRPNTEELFTLLDQHSVPLIRPSTDAIVLHQPVKRHVLSVRATYQRAAEKAVIYLASTGITRIAVIHVDDSFEIDGLEGVRKGLKPPNLNQLPL